MIMIFNHNFSLSIKLQGAKIHHGLPNNGRGESEQIQTKRGESWKAHAHGPPPQELDHLIHSFIQKILLGVRADRDNGILFMATGRVAGDDDPSPGRPRPFFKVQALMDVGSGVNCEVGHVSFGRLTLRRRGARVGGTSSLLTTV